MAPLHLIHIMGGNQNGEAAICQPMNFIPEITPRLGVHTRGWLVQQKQFRLVHDAGGKRQPLLPAARKRARQLAAARGEAQFIQCLRNMIFYRIELVETGKAGSSHYFPPSATGCCAPVGPRASSIAARFCFTTPATISA